MALAKGVPLVLAQVDLAVVRAHAALDGLVLRGARLFRGPARDRRGVAGRRGPLLLGSARLARRVWHPRLC